MKLKLSNIVEQNKLFDSESFKELSPKLKEAVSDIFKLVKNEGNIIFNFENAVDKVAERHNVNTKLIYDYFDNEVNERLGDK